MRLLHPQKPADTPDKADREEENNHVREISLCRLTACALLPALLLPLAAAAAAPAVETDEAVYINPDYYGMPEDTRIVKGVNLNGHTSFTDYGDYSAVYNMSTYDEPALSDGSVTGDRGRRTAGFYYECIPNGRSLYSFRGISMYPISLTAYLSKRKRARARPV